MLPTTALAAVTRIYKVRDSNRVLFTPTLSFRAFLNRLTAAILEC